MFLFGMFLMAYNVFKTVSGAEAADDVIPEPEAAH
jgi:cbb3-type cytochrome oxidase subunit 1